MIYKNTNLSVLHRQISKLPFHVYFTVTIYIQQTYQHCFDQN